MVPYFAQTNMGMNRRDEVTQMGWAWRLCR